MTKGLPSRSPPIQLPTRKKAGSAQRAPRVARFQPLGRLDVEIGEFGEERAGEIADPALHFVDDLEPQRAQHAGLPGVSTAAARRYRFPPALRRQLLAVPQVEQALDLPLALQVLWRWTSVGAP